MALATLRQLAALLFKTPAAGHRRTPQGAPHLSLQ